MKSWFFRLFILGNFVIIAIGLSYGYFEKATAKNNPGALAVDTLTLNEDARGDALDKMGVIHEEALRETMPYSVTFSLILLLGFFIILLVVYLQRREPKIFDRILGATSDNSKPSGSFVDPGYDEEVVQRQIEERLRK